MLQSDNNSQFYIKKGVINNILTWVVGYYSSKKRRERERERFCLLSYFAPSFAFFLLPFCIWNNNTRIFILSPFKLSVLKPGYYQNSEEKFK